jgi:hypothetical protein
MSTPVHPDVFAAALNLSQLITHMRHKADGLRRACTQHGVAITPEVATQLDDLRLRCVETSLWLDEMALPSAEVTAREAR